MAKEHVKRITSIGGQALIEGVMMRGPRKTSMAVRLPDGSIDLTELSTPSLRQKYAVWRVPVLRGIATFVDSLRAGFQALSLSAEKSGIDEEEGEPSKFDLWLEKKFGDKIMNVIMAAGTVLGVLLAIIIKTFATGACSEDMLGSFICAGIGGAFMAQIFVNGGMNLRLLPVIGVTLPFYSAGGSSVLMLYICVGLVLSVYMHNTKKLFG